MATKAARTRLTREYKTMQKEPTPYIVAHPCETNILEYVRPPPLSPAAAAYGSGVAWM